MAFEATVFKRSFGALNDLHAKNVWLVSGTPFPHGDRSMFGIHQLLGLKLKLTVSASPFTVNNSPSLPPSHPFQRLKPLVYFRNTILSIKHARSAENPPSPGSSLSEASPRSATSASLSGWGYEERMVPLSFTPIERTFYDAQRNRGEYHNPYSPRCDKLRKLCVHPAILKEFSAFVQEAGGLSAENQQLHSLSHLRKLMVEFKEHRLLESMRQIHKLRRKFYAAIRARQLQCNVLKESAPCISLVWLPPAKVSSLRKGELWWDVDSTGNDWSDDDVSAEENQDSADDDEEDEEGDADALKQPKEAKDGHSNAKLDPVRAKGVAGIFIETGVSRMDPRAKRVCLPSRTALGFLATKFDVNGGFVQKLNRSWRSTMHFLRKLGREDHERFRVFVERKESEIKDSILKLKEETIVLSRELGFFQGVIADLRSQGKTADCTTCLEARSLLSVTPCGHFSCTEW